MISMTDEYLDDKTDYLLTQKVILMKVLDLTLTDTKTNPFMRVLQNG